MALQIGLSSVEASFGTRSFRQGMRLCRLWLGHPYRYPFSRDSLGAFLGSSALNGSRRVQSCSHCRRHSCLEQDFIKKFSRYARKLIAK